MEVWPQLYFRWQTCYSQFQPILIPLVRGIVFIMDLLPSSGIPPPPQQVVINCSIPRGLNYHKARPNFHQWRDPKQQVYGLNFAALDEAEAFAAAIEAALEQLAALKRQQEQRQQQQMPQQQQHHHQPSVHQPIANGTLGPPPQKQPPPHQQQTQHNQLSCEQPSYAEPGRLNHRVCSFLVHPLERMFFSISCVFPTRTIVTSLWLIQHVMHWFAEVSKRSLPLETIRTTYLLVVFVARDISDPVSPDNSKKCKPVWVQRSWCIFKASNAWVSNVTSAERVQLWLIYLKQFKSTLIKQAWFQSINQAYPSSLFLPLGGNGPSRGICDRTKPAMGASIRSGRCCQHQLDGWQPGWRY